ncbi:MAG: flagellar brake protein [Firmicutes bacterium]|nr:flagellar brake protein [Bacillota bacterium]
MISDVIKINERVEIEVTRRGKPEVYPSRIESLEDSGILLAAPLRGGLVQPIPIGGEVKIVVPYQDSIYAFNTTVLARREGHIPYILVRWPEELSQANRRGYFRLDVLLNMTYAILPKGVNKGELPIPNKSGLIKNLSGSGLLAWIKNEHDLIHGSELLVDIHLPVASGQVTARVVRKTTIPDDPENRIAVGLHIEKIASKFRDEIIRYLFQEQRERRSKGIL